MGRRRREWLSPGRWIRMPRGKGHPCPRYCESLSCTFHRRLPVLFGLHASNRALPGRVGATAALLVGFFLAGLVVHGGLQGWWIGPVLSGLREVPLFFGATILTAFNNNAAITNLASLVLGFSDGMKYAVVAGAVA